MGKIDSWMSRRAEWIVGYINRLMVKYYSWPWDRNTAVALEILLAHSTEELAGLAREKGDFQVNEHLLQYWHRCPDLGQDWLAEQALRAALERRQTRMQRLFRSPLVYARRAWLFVHLLLISMPFLLLAVVVDAWNWIQRRWKS